MSNYVLFENFYTHAQLSTRDIQKFDFKKVVFRYFKKTKIHHVFDVLPEWPIIPYSVRNLFFCFDCLVFFVISQLNNVIILLKNVLPLILKGLCWGETHQMKKAEDEPYVPIDRVTRLSKILQNIKLISRLLS